MTDAPRNSRWVDMERRYRDSPIHNILGLSLHVQAAGTVRVDFDGRDDAGNRRGTPAGGALAEMIDSAVVQAARTLLSGDDRATTLELKVNFVRSAGREAKLTTEGSIEYEGGSTAVGVGRVRDLEGRLVAIGLVTVSIKRTEKGNDVRHHERGN